MSLDLAVSQAIVRIRAMERALHDSGPWYIDLNGPNGCLSVLADRRIHDDHITFTIPVLHDMRAGRTVPSMTLRCGNDVVLTRGIDQTILDEEGELDWAIGLDPVAA